jgi:hypothetical protein
MADFRNRVHYSHVIFHVWFVLAILCGVAAAWCVIAGEWGWVLGWTVGAVALSAHARLERFDGHKHGHGVEVP